MKLPPKLRNHLFGRDLLWKRLKTKDYADDREILEAGKKGIVLEESRLPPFLRKALWACKDKALTSTKNLADKEAARKKSIPPTIFRTNPEDFE